jgi:hypothetical protein
MRIVRVLGVLLASSVVTAQPETDVERALAAFADDGLPALVERLTDADPAMSRDAAIELAALGAPAHEVLLGVWLRRSGPRPAGLATAFGEFDAGCGWALPVLIGDPRQLADPLCRDLLQRLGAAALPAIDELRRQRETGADHKPVTIRGTESVGDRVVRGTVGVMESSGEGGRSGRKLLAGGWGHNATHQTCPATSGGRWRPGRDRRYSGGSLLKNAGTSTPRAARARVSRM